MPVDSKAMGLLIRMVPLMRREFARTIDTTSFFDDTSYAMSVIDEALRAKEERLVGYARELRFRLEELSRGPVSGVRSRSSGADTAGPSTLGAPSTINSPPTLPPDEGNGNKPDDPGPGNKRYLKSLR